MGREKRRENEDGEQEKMNKKGSKNRPSNSPIFHGKGTRIGGNRQGARVCAGSEAREHTHTHRHRERERIGEAETTGVLEKVNWSMIGMDGAKMTSAKKNVRTWGTDAKQNRH